jgi:hypothetical protein
VLYTLCSQSTAPGTLAQRSLAWFTYCSAWGRHGDIMLESVFSQKLIVQTICLKILSDYVYDSTKRQRG